MKNGREKTVDAPRSGAPSPATDERHLERHLSLNARAVFHKRLLLQKSESWQQIFTVSSPIAWGKEKLVQSGIHICSVMTTDPCLFSLPPPICSIEETNASFALILTVDESLYSFDYWLKQLNAEWRAEISPGRKLHGTLRLLRKPCLSCSSA